VGHTSCTSPYNIRNRFKCKPKSVFNKTRIVGPKIIKDVENSLKSKNLISTYKMKKKKNDLKFKLII